jgi:AcrR family transcriptional regulator
VLDAAATLFALRGVDAVSLRDIAAAADAHLELIRLYVGAREKLVLAVFDYLSDQVARAVAEYPLSGQGVQAGHGDGEVGAGRRRALDPSREAAIATWAPAAEGPAGIVSAPRIYTAVYIAPPAQSARAEGPQARHR